MPSDARNSAFLTAKRAGGFALLVALSSAASPDASPEVASWPDTRSPVPAPAAWKSAESFSVKRVFGAKAGACTVRRIAEWVQVKCPELKTAAITELAGNDADVSYYIEPAGDDRVPGAGHVTFRARRGDRRVFLFWTLGPGYDGPLTVTPAVVVQESFSAGSAEPLLTMTDALHEPVGTRTHPRPPPF
jgi:hypothetical protein